MTIKERDLFDAGFTESDVESLHRRLAAEEGNLNELISVLSRRFRVAFWVTFALVVVMFVTTLCGPQKYLISGGLGTVVVLAIIWGIFSPFLAWKANRLQKKISHQTNR
ncbi:hypothetical protein ACO30A_003649 [Klebsiella aerogenes]